MKQSPYHIKHWPVWFAILLLRLFSLLPVRWRYATAKGLGLVAHRFLHRRRHVAEVNIDLCFPELTPSERQDLVKENFIATAWGVIDITLAFWAKDAYFAEHSEVHGLELLHQAQQQGQGVLLLGIHVTSLEASGRTLGLRSADMDVTYKQADNLAFDHYLRNRRQQTFKHVIEKYDMRTTLRNLKEGRIVWLASDQDFGRKGAVFAPFFHQPAATLDNLGRITKITGTKVLFYNHYRIIKNGAPYFVGEVLDPFTDGFSDDALANATLYNQVLADAIRRHPEQYLWLQKRFRTRPDANAPRLYTSKKRSR